MKWMDTYQGLPANRNCYRLSRISWAT